MKSKKHITPELQKLGSIVRAERRKHALNQAELAVHAGCGHVFIIDLERGKPTLRLHKVLDVLKVLGLQIRIERGKKGLVAQEEF